MKQFFSTLIILLLIAGIFWQLALLLIEEQQHTQAYLALEMQQPDLIAPLTSEKRRLEASLAALRADIHAATYAPSTIWVLACTENAEQLAACALYLDPYPAHALLGVHETMLAAWQSGGVPQHILSRLEAGWALCLCADDADALPISQALDAHIAHLQRIDRLPEWLRQQAALEESLSDINARIQMIAPQ